MLSQIFLPPAGHSTCHLPSQLGNTASYRVSICLFLAVFLVMKASWLNLRHLEKVSRVRERRDFIGSESHCEFIIAGKEQNEINESLNWW